LPKFDENITSLPGIGPARAKTFARLGIESVRDLLFHIPRGYEDRSRIRTLAEGRDGEYSCFLLTVGSEPRSVRLPSRITLTNFRVFDASGSVEAVFFNQDFLKNVFSVGDEFRFCGKLSAQGRTYQLVSPKYEKYDPLDPPPDICPVYGLTEGLSGSQIRKAIDAAIAQALPTLTDYLPEEIRRKYSLPTLTTALRALHKPTDFASVQAASRRMAFDEFFLFSLGVSLSGRKSSLNRISPFPAPDKKRFFSQFSYAPTNAQLRVCDEIAKDMTADTVMQRILVGDVGCGKTLCAAFAAFTAVSAGKQAALMVPTEILARQHFADLEPIFAALGYKTALLLGSTGVAEKRKIREALSTAGDGRIDLLIGTHALLNENIRFYDLGLTVVDEQHRFGVGQRTALREKNPDAHMLVMSATPIPRTLALVLYGDLSVSRIDEMPKGRKRVATYVVDSSYRARLRAFIRKQTELGGQVYVVCPAIEKQEELEEGNVDYSLFRDEKPPLRTAAEVTEELKAACPDLTVGFLHGKMRSSEKDAIMQSFVCGETQVLVSTTVIEVGVNNPNATLMIIEDADRFGLAQLHQLRGRVGRGTKEAFCVLVSDAKGEEARARLDTMRTTYDGFLVAEQDLRQRGPGDFLAMANGGSIRQSGGMALRFASLLDDADLITAAASEAQAILAKTGEEAEAYLQRESALFEEVQRTFRLNAGSIS